MVNFFTTGPHIKKKEKKKKEENKKGNKFKSANLHTQAFLCYKYIKHRPRTLTIHTEYKFTDVLHKYDTAQAQLLNRTNRQLQDTYSDVPDIA